MSSGVASVDTTVPVRTYAQSLSSLSCDASECLLFEASGRGLEAARELGIATVVVRSCCAGEHVVGDALAVVDELSEIAISSSGSSKPLEVPKDRWIEAVQALHAKAGKWLESGEGGVVMRVSDILKEKGSEVKTIKPGELIQTFARRLSEGKVGAMVVLGQQDSIEGIISERDLARGLAEHGSELSAMRVTDLMTKVVITCAPADSILGVANVMTRRRIRHLPVTERGKLVGLISIGDVLKFRLEELQLEANILRDYTIALR
jgi:CBS domain-containing protein